jgi:signal transduction histidine kinase
MSKISQAKRKKFLILFFIIVCIFVITGGIIYYKYQANSIRRTGQDQLTAIANLKASQIQNWNLERLDDAENLTNNPFFIEGLKRFISSKTDTSLEAALLNNLYAVNSYSVYYDIIITDTSGNLLLNLNPDLTRLDEKETVFIRKSAAERHILNTGLYIRRPENKIHMDYIAPFIDKAKNVFALVIFDIDPNKYLYPLMQSWPVPSRSSETLICRKEGSNVIFLNNLRHQKDAALKLIFPLSKADLPAVQAVLGYKGLFEGKDYRGEDVISYVLHIPGTPWSMVAKIDKSELYSNLHVIEFALISFAVLFILLLTSGLIWFFYYNERNIYKALFETEKELGEYHAETEKTLLENEARLTELNATKDKFFSIIAHDLRNPFQILLSMTEILANGIDDLDKKELSEFSKQLYNATRNQHRLLENLLSWAQLQQDQNTYNPRRIELYKLTEDVFELIGGAAAAKNILLENNVDKKISVMADPDMMHSVLSNLITNAIKFTYPQGRVEVSAVITENMARVSVRDNGVGIEKDKIGKLFNIKSNSNSRGTADERGTGLGLVLCKEFVEKQQGRIWVESEPGKGSNFIFTIPLAAG